MNLRKFALISLLVMAPFQGAMAAAPTSPEYTCLAGPSFIKVPLTLGVSSARGASFSGRFSVAADDYGVALAQPVTADLYLVRFDWKDASAFVVTLSARVGEQSDAQRSNDPEMIPGLSLMVSNKNGVASKVSIQCKTQTQWDMEYEITEGKIQASMRQD